jgi:SAM-dependent methyltransferase
MPETESEKALSRILHLLEGKQVLDLGCGRRPVVPWATGVDDSSECQHLRPGTISAKIDPESRQIQSFHQVDVVFSSHALEHMRSPILETLRYWLGLVKPAGRLILYLPDERRYVFDQKSPTTRNPGHHHYLTADTFHWYLEQLPVDIELFQRDPEIFDHYSFLVVARKR